MVVEGDVAIVEVVELEIEVVELELELELGPTVYGCVHDNTFACYAINASL